MKSLLKVMKKKNSGIPEDTLSVFEGIIKKYEALGGPSLGPECDAEFTAAMRKLLSKEQRYLIYGQYGACMGTGYDKGRAAFAQAHAEMPFAERFKLFTETQGKNAALNSDGTITVIFGCSHGYYKSVRDGKTKTLPENIESYFEGCAGGRLHEYEKTLGVKLKIKSVDISALYDNMLAPVTFVFEPA
ncbi:MAG: hypothetical protein FWE82_01450 [Defluviitaleaceae bacterium]|nr:hypothetical protein [Defluviitaleaceae bacterium]